MYRYRLTQCAVIDVYMKPPCREEKNDLVLALHDQHDYEYSWNNAVLEVLALYFFPFDTARMAVRRKVRKQGDSVGT